MKSVAAAFLVLALSLPLAARADDATHRAKAQEMMSLLQSQHLVNQISENFTRQMSAAADNIIGPKPTPQKRAEAAAFEKDCQQDIDTQLSWAALEPAFTDIYVKNFTEEQMDQIIAFYKTPAGTALLATMPIVNKEVSEYGTQRLQTTLEPQLKDLYIKFRLKEGAGPIPTVNIPPAASAPVHPSSAPKK